MKKIDFGIGLATAAPGAFLIGFQYSLPYLATGLGLLGLGVVAVLSGLRGQ